MFVLPNGIISYKTGDLLAPSDLSENYKWINQTIKDVGDQRYTHTPVLYRLAAEGSPLTNTDYTTDAQRCRAYFTRHTDAVEIERIFCSAIYTASQPIDFYVKDPGNSSVTGNNQPVFTLPAKAALEDDPEEPILTNSFMMTSSAGNYYYVSLVPRSAGTFSFDKLDITVVFKTDCFNFTDFTTLDSLDLTFTEADPPDANRILALQTAITNAANAIAAARRPFRPALIQIDNFTSATDANLRRAELPRALATSNYTFANQYVLTLYTTTVAGKTTTLLVANQAGTTQYTSTINVGSGATIGSVSTVTGVDLTATPGPLDPASDWRITVSTNTATVYRVCNLMWFY